jgi:hypothetical protein
MVAVEIDGLDAQAPAHPVEQVSQKTGTHAG